MWRGSSGVIESKEAAPRFQEELQIVMKDTDLPSVVEFGRIDDNGC
ncbi:hypothetical protein [Paenibacillus sp. HGF7]|nr:hypothetical protein [Paenibacillus sp. HGF7]